MLITIVVAPLDRPAESWAAMFGAQLERYGCRAAFRWCTERTQPDADATVVASSLHGTRWAPHTMRFLETHRHQLAARPSWLVQVDTAHARRQDTPMPRIPATVEQLAHHAAARIGYSVAPTGIGTTESRAAEKSCRQLTRWILGTLAREQSPTPTAPGSLLSGSATKSTP